MDKILIIAQAPPLKGQSKPMDSTLLGMWLNDAGFSFDNLEDIFEFEAVYNEFPGKTASGSHKAPTRAQMDTYWPTLREKVLKAKKIWLMGKTAHDYVFTEKNRVIGVGRQVISTLHPSRRNLHKYRQDKEAIIKTIQYLFSN